MTKYIDAEKLIAEIERRKKQLFEIGGDMFENKWACGSLDNIKEFVISFQNGQPGVDLDKEIDLEWKKCQPTDEGMGLESANIVNEQFEYIARHFYELGLNARKEETK